MDYSNGRFLSSMDFPIVFPLLVVGTITLIILRVIYIIYRSSKPVYTRSPGPLSTLIILGSGGHTAEMLNLLAVLQKERFKPRYYVAAATDNMSLQKARFFEDSLVDEAGIDVVGTAHFMQIYRSREVGQSYITSIGTTLIAIAHALWLMVRMQPQVVLYCPFLFQILFLIYINAHCYILFPDFVQWPWNLYTPMCNFISFKGFRD
ncbi:UDP-N-acetylglucosamine transferase subunit ALG14 homolog [Olea europaea subsp. europaea]|uniref:UDP-N-acetylglucosamine transferase subunit ALG14 n=1 Tax=Olea europaea subsp. europaea TaxID=158383 RepID=A0A8S0T8I0_OLEEU|nr:UDP-N-acetylglucosamine transferase subunit ALG14 homolog [Olea europaea subsp. europaea]